jgi:hypothetical protein
MSDDHNHIGARKRNFIAERLLASKLIDIRTAPATAAIFLGKKYLLPAKRQGDYFDQDTINWVTLGGFLEAALSGKILQTSRAEFVNMMLAIRCGRPTFFLERELAEIFLESRIPEDLTINDVQTQFPSFRIMIPSRILTLGEYWATCVDVAIWDGSNLKIEFPPAICKETDFKSNFSFQDKDGIGHLLISIYMNGGPYSYNTTKPWKNGKLTNVLEYQFNDSNSFSTIETDDERLFLRRVEAFTLNLLLFLSGVPAEYKAEVMVRKARTIGKKLRPALAHAKFIGDYMIRARADGRVKGELPTGKTKAAHWVRPHWRRQPHGIGRALRRLVWILPYHTGKLDIMGVTP